MTLAALVSMAWFRHNCSELTRQVVGWSCRVEQLIDRAIASQPIAKINAPQLIDLNLLPPGLIMFPRIARWSG